MDTQGDCIRRASDPTACDVTRGGLSVGPPPTFRKDFLLMQDVLLASEDYLSETKPTVFLGLCGFTRRLLFRNINHVIVIIINFVQTPYFKMYAAYILWVFYTFALFRNKHFENRHSSSVFSCLYTFLYSDKLRMHEKVCIRLQTYQTK